MGNIPLDKTHKSKDIDIAVNYDTLQSLRTKYKLQKNERMHKYEIKQDIFDIDIYLPFYSKLAIPLEDLEQLSTKIEGIRVPKTEVLLLLKQAAEIDRRNTIKGKKDSIDIMTLMLRTSVDIKKYLLLTKKYGLEQYPKELLYAIEKFSEQDIDYLGIDYVQFKKEKTFANDKNSGEVKIE
jgi:hypothetical protein